MDDRQTNTTPSTAAKFGMYAMFLLAWFLVGGSISFLPMLLHSIERVAGEFALKYSIILWCGFPFTGGIFIFSKNLFTTTFLVINFVCWLPFAGWVWFHAFQL